MKLGCYSVYDRKTAAYHMPFYAPTDAAAARTLSDAVADPGSMLGRHPNDYVLYYVGDFDDQAGSYEPFAPPRHIVDVIALVPAQPELPLAPEAGRFIQDAANGKAVF